MYIQDKDEAKDNFILLRDALDDCWKWDANHDDVFNEELGRLAEILEEMNLKLKTL